MGRPDLQRAHRQHRHIADFVGETASWVTYVSASEGVDAYGVGDEPQYQTRTVTALLRPAAFEEVQAAGGQFMAGDMMATMLDAAPGPRDEVICRDVTYRIAADTWPQPVLHSSAFRMVLRRGDATR